jgi:hypothetical protein
MRPAAAYLLLAIAVAFCICGCVGKYSNPLGVLGTVQWHVHRRHKPTPTKQNRLGLRALSNELKSPKLKCTLCMSSYYLYVPARYSGGKAKKATPVTKSAAKGKRKPSKFEDDEEDDDDDDSDSDDYDGESEDDEDNNRGRRRISKSRSASKSRSTRKGSGRGKGKKGNNQLIPWGAVQNYAKGLNIRGHLEDIAKKGQSVYKDVYRRAKVRDYVRRTE